MLINLLIIIEEVGIFGVVFEMCGVWCELGVLWEVLFEVMSLGLGVGVVNELFGVFVLLELFEIIIFII